MRIPLRRIGVYCIAFLFAIVMNFAVPRLMPGSPVDGMIAQLGQRVWVADPGGNRILSLPLE